MKRVYALLAICSAAAIGQESAPRFEVASIKPASPDARGNFIRSMPGGRMEVTNMTLKDMMTLAWQVQPFQVEGGPPWISSARYDINAKAEKAPAQGEMPLMMQALLQDRFGLVIRKETREMPIYAIVLARKDGKLGPKMIESKEGSCVKYDPQQPPPTERGKAPAFCGNMFMGLNRMQAVAAPVSNLPGMMSRMLGRTVIDKTGLTGKYDMQMEWTPDETQLGQFQPPAGAERPTFAEGGPSIFTAFQEQLGLKLEAQKGPVEILVIEKVEKPGEN